MKEGATRQVQPVQYVPCKTEDLEMNGENAVNFLKKSKKNVRVNDNLATSSLWPRPEPSHTQILGKNQKLNQTVATERINNSFTKDYIPLEARMKKEPHKDMSLLH